MNKLKLLAASLLSLSIVGCTTTKDPELVIGAPQIRFPTAPPELLKRPAPLKQITAPVAATKTPSETPVKEIPA